ncbi:hypothetical protein BB560_000367 [Smittium megazygosporum]|uniref:HMG box domain-containing protein n=1 Tax=Smittium megazygosporum TaxID=133381 RepID=A0A2T9ZKH2_9FUNG|nr:hypothetical protein BB560_000367 [Smittium megazygosporum]
MFSINQGLPLNIQQQYAQLTNGHPMMNNIRNGMEFANSANESINSVYNGKNGALTSHFAIIDNQMVNYNDFDESSKRRTRAEKAKRTPRPPNSFILYRKDKQEEVIKNNPGVSNKEISCIIGSMWKSESKEVKERYRISSEDEKKKHKKLYPNYKYQPRKSKKGLKSENDFRFGSNPLFNAPIQTKLFPPNAKSSDFNFYAGNVTNVTQQVSYNGNFVDASSFGNNNMSQVNYRNQQSIGNVSPSVASPTDSVGTVPSKNTPQSTYSIPASIKNSYSPNHNQMAFAPPNLLSSNTQQSKNCQISHGNVNIDTKNDVMDSLFFSSMISNPVLNQSVNESALYNMNGFRTSSSSNNIPGIPISLDEILMDNNNSIITPINLEGGLGLESLKGSFNMDYHQGVFENIEELLDSNYNNSQFSDVLSTGGVDYLQMNQSSGVVNPTISQSISRNPVFSLPEV